jgi:hypothetical protein
VDAVIGQQVELIKMLFGAAAAVWGFYGATQVALLGFIAFPKKENFLPPPSVRETLIKCLWLYFVLNAAGILVLQTLAIELVPKDFLKAEWKPWVHIVSVGLVLLHLVLDYFSIRLTERAIPAGVGQAPS